MKYQHAFIMHRKFGDDARITHSGKLPQISNDCSVIEMLEMMVGN